MADDIVVRILGDAGSFVTSAQAAQNQANQLAAAFQAQAAAALKAADAQSQASDIMKAYRDGTFTADIATKELATTLQLKAAAAAQAAAADEALAAAQMTVASTAEAATAATGSSGLTRALTLAAGRVVGTEVGAGMLGAQFARVGVAAGGMAGAMGPLLLALIAVGAVIGAVEIYEKYEQSLIDDANAAADLEHMVGKANDALMTQQENLAGLTGGPLAKYSAELDDVSKRSLDMSGDIQKVSKDLETQSHWWANVISWMERYSSLAIEPTAPKDYGDKDLDKFTSQLNKNYTTQAQLPEAIAAIGAELNKVHAIEEAAAAENGGYDNAFAQGIERRRVALQALYDTYSSRGQEVITEIQEKQKEQLTKGLEQTVATLQANKPASEVGLATAGAAQLKSEADNTLKLAEANEKLAEAKMRADAAQSNRGSIQSDLQAELAAAQAVNEAKVAQARTEAANTTAINQTKQAELREAAEREKEIANAQVAAAQGNSGKIIQIRTEEKSRLADIQNQIQALDVENVTVQENLAAQLKTIEQDYEDDKVRLANGASSELARIANEEVTNQNDALKRQTEQIKAAIAEQERIYQEAQKVRQEREKTGGGGLLGNLSGNTGTPVTADQLAALEAAKAANEQQQTAVANNPNLTTADQQQQINNLKQQEIGIDDQIAAAQQKIADAMDAARAKQQQALQQMTQSFNSNIIGWINGSETFGRAMQKVWTNLADTAIMNLLKVAEEQVLTDLMALRSHQVSNQLKVASDASAAAQGNAISSAAASQNILKSAAQAAAGAFSAVMKDVPFPFNAVLAPLAAAGAFAGTMAFGKFEKGGLVPETGVNLLHAREMVLPAKLSDFVQNAARNASSEGGGTGGINGDVHMHYAPTISEPFNPQKHGDEMMSVMKGKLQRLGVQVT